jgi:hypothetical protein
VAVGEEQDTKVVTVYVVGVGVGGGVVFPPLHPPLQLVTVMTDVVRVVFVEPPVVTVTGHTVVVV